MSSMRLWSIPFAMPTNPYVTLINAELERLGVRINAPGRAWLGRLQADDIVHFHWPSYLYASDTRAGTESLLGHWGAFLNHIRDRGAKIVWTAHNLHPHDNPFPDLDRAARSLFISRCDHIVLHCGVAAELLAREYGALPSTSVLRHPDFALAYPPVPRRDAARRELAVTEDAFVFLIFGQIRAYKGIEFAASCFTRLAERRVRLVIAGEPDGAYAIDGLRELAAADRRIVLRTERVPVGAVAAYFGCADISVHGYRTVLTSGAVCLAQSMGKPVIAPRLGCIEDAVPEGTGILYQASSSQGLLAAMHQAMTADLQAMGARARLHIASQTPRHFAEQLLRVYQTVLQPTAG